MPLVDDIQEAFRDFVSWSASYPLPVGNPSTGVHNPSKADIRNVLIEMLRASGDPEALQDILTALETKADAANSTPSYANRAAAVNGAVGLPGPVTRIMVQEGGALVIRSRTAFADDPLYPSGSQWGVMLRLDLPAEALMRATQDSLLAATFAPVQDRTATLMDVLPIPIGPRLMQPEVLSFDLAVERGYWLDTGLPWLPGGQMDDLFEVTDLNGITVTEWSFDLRPLRGYVTATGEAWPDGSGASLASNSRFLVDVVSPTLIHIYIWQFGSTYVRWALEHAVIPARNANVWRIGSGHHVTRSGDDFTIVQEIAFNGETDVAIMLRQSVGGAAKPDHIGGATHGNEEMQYVSILINGVAISPAASIGMRSAMSLEVLQASDMFEPGNTEATVWSPKGPLIMQHYKRLYIDESGWWRQQSRIAHVVGGFQVNNSYFGMLCLMWGTRGYNSVHTGARAPLWATEDISQADFVRIFDASNHVKAWGDLYAGEVRMVEGWASPGRNVEINNRPDRRKIYPDFHDGDITATDTPWSVGVDYRITIKEPV